MAKEIVSKSIKGGFGTILKNYFLAFSIMLMLFGILLLPSSHIMMHDISLIDEVLSQETPSTKTPFVNNKFVFYWSPIDPLYDQADTEQNYPWGIENGHNDDNNNGQTDDEERRGINFYGDSYISDEGAISIGSYKDNNKITVTLSKGHIFTDNFKKDYPENTIRSSDGSVYDADENDNGKPDRDPKKKKIDLYDPARAPLNSPDLAKVENQLLWTGTLDKYEGKIFYTTRDWWMWDGVVEVESTGRVTVQKMTVTDGYIDKNGNGFADLWDDCDMDDGSYNNGDDETSHGVDTAWFSNGMSDDAVWSFYGDEFFGFVHRDLMIASYDDENTIEIIDVTDGDDSRKVTLDAWENFQWSSTFVTETWCGGDDAGDNNELDWNTYSRELNWSRHDEVKEFMESDIIKNAIDSGNFESDWVVVKADKPVTIYGGIWDNNFHTQAYGFLGSRYYVPLSTAITITGLEKEAHIELNFDDESEKDEIITVKPGQQYTYKSMTPRPFSNNYVAEVSWVQIISDWPIRVEFWMANDDNAFDETQISTFKGGFDYYPAMENWDLAIHHRCLVYIIALEDDTTVGWTGSWLSNKPSGATLDKHEIYRVVVDSNEDYNGDESDDTEPDNQDELESVMQMMRVNANKEVMLEVRYARDFSCEPQDMDIVLSLEPCMQRNQRGDNFWPLPLVLSVFFIVDMTLVVSGSKGIVGSLSYTDDDKLSRLFRKSK